MSTIKDIAAALGISHSTVSRALNDSPLVSDQTKEKVRKVAKELNYIPNENARNLKLAKSYNIGVFFSSIQKGTSSSLIYQVTRKISKSLENDYNIVIKGIDTYTSQYDSINRQNFQGIIVFSQKVEDDAFIEKVVMNNIPIIVALRKVKDMDVTCVYSDDYKGASLAIDRLYEKGHREINIISGRRDFYSNIQRIKGTYRSVEENGMKVLGIESGDYSYESGYKAMKRVIRANELGTALFAFNDDMAVGAMKACIENGIKIPEDYSVIGFDADELTNYTIPALTTIKRPVGEICYKAAKILLEEINNENHKKQHIVYYNNLVKRESIKKVLKKMQ